MTISEITAKSILRKQKKVDSWFISRYGMNLYRGCTHNCSYCDGRSEKYRVEGEFGEDIAVKVNAGEILNKELDPARKRVPFKKGFILLGGGVGDSYQPIDKKYLLSRKALQVIHKYGFPVHVLTKSTLVKRDIDLLTAINNQSRAIVSFSFSSADDTISALFEPHVPSPSERLSTISCLKNEGISCGMFLMPVIPYITDSAESIMKTLQKAKDAGIDFAVFGGMTLKEGRQKGHFFDILERNYPHLCADYEKMYTGNKWGSPPGEYYSAVSTSFYNAADSLGIPMRIPLSLFNGLVEKDDQVVIILEHMDHLLKMRGEKSSYGYAAYSLSQVKQPLVEIKDELQKLKGVGPVTARIVNEILETGDCSYYRKLNKT